MELGSVNSYWFVAMVEIVILAGFYYFVLLFFSGTRSVQVVTGLIVALLVLFGATQFFRLDALNWLLRQISVYLAIGFLIIFAPEIRRALAELGRPHTFAVSDSQMSAIDQILQAVSLLEKMRIGALIAIEREIGTRAIQETGVALDSKVVSGLLAGIFFPQGPLHDGGVIIRGDRIVAASCLFPVTQSKEVDDTLGMRHRAAIGLTEETDAVVIVVSEETGTVSVGYRGRLSEGIDADELRKFLSRLLARSRRKNMWERMRTKTHDSADSIEPTIPAGEEGKTDGSR